MFIRFLTVTIGCVISASPACAHKLIVVATIKGERVRVEAFYDDDTPAQQAKVIIESDGKRVVAEGRTDERGLWSCPIPAPGEFTVRAESTGHAAKDFFVIPEPGGTPSAPVVANQSVTADTPAQPGAARESRDQSRPTREEMTGTPWLQIAIGFAIIGSLCVGAMILRKRRHSPDAA